MQIIRNQNVLNFTHATESQKVWSNIFKILRKIIFYLEAYVLLSYKRSIRMEWRQLQTFMVFIYALCTLLGNLLHNVPHQNRRGKRKTSYETGNENPMQKQNMEYSWNFCQSLKMKGMLLQSKSRLNQGYRQHLKGSPRKEKWKLQITWPTLLYRKL